MYRIRRGKDFKVIWSFFDCDGKPYFLEREFLTMYAVNSFCTFEVTDFTVDGNTVIWLFRGKDQKNLGDYSLELVKNNGGDGMIPIDTVDAFTLVQYTRDEARCDGGNVKIEDVTISSELSVETIAQLTIDTELSESSFNAIANAVVTKALKEKVDKSEVPSIHSITSIDGFMDFVALAEDYPLSNEDIDAILSGKTIVTGTESGGVIPATAVYVEGDEYAILEFLYRGEMYRIYCDLVGKKIIGSQSTITPVQEKLKSGKNIKTINGESLLGEGNIVIPTTGGGGSYDDTEIKNKLTELSAEINGGIKKYDSSILIAGGLVNSDTGNVESNVYRSYSDYIPITPNGKIKFSVYGTIASSQGYAFYDKDKKFIEGKAVVLKNDIDTYAPSNALFLRVTWVAQSEASYNEFYAEVGTIGALDNIAAMQPIVSALKEDYYSSVLVGASPSLSLDGKYLDANGNLIAGIAFEVECFEVMEGDHYVLTESGGLGGSRAYALYNVETLNDGSIIAANATFVASNIGTFVSEIAIPKGTNVLAITRYKSFTLYKVEKQVPLPLSERVKALEDINSPNMCVEIGENGEDAYIAYLENGIEWCYWFKRCMANLLYTFHRVGYRTTTRKKVDTEGIADWKGMVTLNEVGSDNIGPMTMQNGGWVGGNHHYPNETASPKYKTAKTDSVEVYVGGKIMEAGLKMYTTEVAIKVVNTIYDPSNPTPNGDILSVMLSTESVIYNVKGNSIEVSVKQQFSDSSDNAVATYYGMQSVFVKETEIITPNGQFDTWTAVSASTNLSFTKGQYPHFNRFVEKNDNGYQSAYLIPNKFGDHRFISDDSTIFVMSSGKCYHRIVASPFIVTGERIVWSGVYSWFVNPLASTSDIFAYKGVLNGKDAIFINTMNECEADIPLPSDLLMRELRIVEASDVIHTENVFTDVEGIHIQADGKGSLIIIVL